MQMEIKARHFTLGDSQIETIEAALEKLEKFSPRPVQSLHLTIDHDAGQFVADAVLHLKAHEFRAKAESTEPEIATTEVVENLRKQLIKYKGKTSGKQKGEEGGLGRAMNDGGLSAGADESSLVLVLKDMDTDTAQESLAALDQPFVVYRNAANGQVSVVYRQVDGGLGHMESAQISE